MSRASLNIKIALITSCLGLASACNREPPPRTVSEFLEDPILLEATMVRCQQNRSQTKYEAECVSAKQAANKLAAAEEQARKEELEAQSARKRKALRRAQEARAEARRRAAEEEKRRQEAEYLGIYEEIVEPVDEAVAGSAEPPLENDATGIAPAVAPQPAEAPMEDTPRQAEITPQVAPPAGDLESIRDELRRRQETDEQQ